MEVSTFTHTLPSIQSLSFLIGFLLSRWYPQTSFQAFKLTCFVLRQKSLNVPQLNYNKLVSLKQLTSV